MGLIVVLSAALAGYALLARPAQAPVLSGYVEGEPLYLASPVNGPLVEINVMRGQRVQAGAPLFRIDPHPLAAQQHQALADVAQAEAQAAAARASASQAQAAATSARLLADNAQTEALRFRTLSRDGSGAVSQQDVDRAVANAASMRAQAHAALAQAAAAKAAATAAERAIGRARGGLDDVTARLAYLTPSAPMAGRIEEVFYQTGEWAAANQPIVSLLPDDRVRLRFFVPETSVARYRPGLSVRFSCDGCGPARRAVINYVSPRPEYTPPVIYSRGSRESLVYLVEAKSDDAARLTPGLPVDVTPLGDRP